MAVDDDQHACVHTEALGARTLRAIEGFRRCSIVAESSLFLLRCSGERSSSLRFELPSELGVKILDCGGRDDASVPARAEEDMETAA